ncbi:MAG: hypothetical protein R3C45_10320 [Phycisphaerales bacterium]
MSMKKLAGSRSLVASLAAVGLLWLPAQTQAQHANFVLFGEPNPDAAQVPAEQKHVHPLTSPYFNEDSFVTTDVRAWFVYHDFPKSSVIGGGNAKVYAAQVRLALTDTLQLVAYKDGYIDFDAGIVKDDGFNDIAAGLKWNFIQDWENQFHMAAGVGYELSTGSSDVLQDDDEWRFWLSANKGFDELHLGGVVNYFIADDPNQGLGNSDSVSWHLHADYYVCEFFSPVVELNGFHVVDDGGVVLPFSGLDVVNLGGSESEDVVTIGIGTELRPCDNVAARVAYETPLTDNDDLYGYRWTFSLIWSF